MLRNKNNRDGLVRKKGILLKIDDYRPQEKELMTINGKHYIGANQSQSLTHVKFPFCTICGKPAEYTGTYDQNGAKQIERYCGPCSKTYGPISTDFKFRVVKLRV